MRKHEKIKKNSKVLPKKRIKRALIVLIVLTFIIVLILINPRFRAHMRLEKINKPDVMDETMPVPEYLSEAITIYYGELTPQVIAKTYYYFSNDLIPKYYKKCKDMSDEKIDKYFNRHKKIIKIELGFTNAQDFKSFIKLIQTLKGEELEFEDYRILADTVHRKNNLINCYLVINYKNNDEIIINTQLLNNNQKNQTSILYSAEIDQEELKKAKEFELEQKETLEKYESPFDRGIPLDMLSE